MVGSDGPWWRPNSATAALAVAILPATWWLHGGDTPSFSDDLFLPNINYTLEDMRHYNGRPGSAGNGTMLLAVWGRVFNVTAGVEFYAPGEVYALFTGYDCTRAFALTKTKANLLNEGLDGIEEAKIKHLNDTYWETYVAKYPIVGVLTDPPYDPVAYDQYAGSFAEDIQRIRRADIAAALANQKGPKRKRQSRCPVTRAARAVGSVISELLPRFLLGAPSESGGETS